MKTKAKQKLLKDACLHCMFLKMHADKWGGWTPSVKNDEAFSDLVGSACDIVIEVFRLLPPHDQMLFWKRVFDAQKSEGGVTMTEPMTLAEVMAMLGATKH